MTEKKKGGARRKGAEGLTEALHILAEPTLIEGLDAIKDRRKKEAPGVKLSRSDVVRNILWAAVHRFAGSGDPTIDTAPPKSFDHGSPAERERGGRMRKAVKP